MLTYPVVLFWSEEDDAFIANVPDLKYCSAHGPTPNSALNEVLVAAEAWLDLARELGMAIPRPSSI